jgi:hypothetical protein
LIITPLIVFVAVGAVIAPKLTLPVVMIALHAAVAGAPTVSVCMFAPVVPVTVNVLAPLLIDGAVITPHVTVFAPRANAPDDVIPPHVTVFAPRANAPDDVIAPHPSVPMPDTAPALIIRPLIVFVVVGAVIAPKLTLPVVKIALHPAVVGALTVNVFEFDPNDVLDTVNVFAPLLIDDAMITPLLRVTPPTELEPAAKVVMVPTGAMILLISNLTPPI